MEWYSWAWLHRRTYYWEGLPIIRYWRYWSLQRQDTWSIAGTGPETCTVARESWIFLCKREDSSLRLYCQCRVLWFRLLWRPVPRISGTSRLCVHHRSSDQRNYSARVGISLRLDGSGRGNRGHRLFLWTSGHPMNPSLSLCCGSSVDFPSPEGHSKTAQFTEGSGQVEGVPHQRLHHQWSHYTSRGDLVSVSTLRKRWKDHQRTQRKLWHGSL